MDKCLKDNMNKRGELVIAIARMGKRRGDGARRKMKGENNPIMFWVINILR